MINKLNNEFINQIYISKGTFGKVYKSYSLKRNCTCAIKKINKEEKYKLCALVEIKILKYLNSLTEYEIPIVNFYGDFIENDIQYIVLEYLETNLYNYYKINYSTIDINTILSITYDICLGLKFIHTKYIHNDLKPENIMINSKSKRIKIIDFGSSLQKNIRRNYFYHQSRYYRSPEIIFELQFNEKIDIWSLGCIITELITNKPLFNGSSTKDLLFKMCEKLDIPQSNEYVNSKKHFTYFTKLYNKEDNKIKYNYLVYNKNKYTEPKYCLEIYLKKYLSTFKTDDNTRIFIIDLIKDIFVYDFKERPSAEDCVNYLNIFCKINKK